ncbi:DNA polymerase III subunit delta' [Thermodesulfobacteriota bacterium]
MKSFTQILGQEKAIGFLKKVIKGDKIPHAYLFTGIEGAGKRTTALALARAVNCKSPIDGDGCGECKVCRQMNSGNFPDYFTIEPDGQNIKIEQIREFNRSINYKPVLGKYRITIINRAEMMTEEAANSFLKTLEEPPPGNIIVLKVIDPLDLLPTIISRCQKVPFKPLPHDIIEKQLISELGETPERASLAARISEGSLSAAINICESDFLKERKEILLNIAKLPDLSRIQLLDMAADFNKKYSKKKSGTGRIDFFELFGIWKTFYRDLILTKEKVSLNMLINSDYHDRLEDISKKLRTDDLLESFFIMDKSQRNLLRNPNVNVTIEKMLLDLRGLIPE